MYWIIYENNQFLKLKVFLKKKLNAVKKEER